MAVRGRTAMEDTIWLLSLLMLACFTCATQTDHKKLCQDLCARCFSLGRLEDEGCVCEPSEKPLEEITVCLEQAQDEAQESGLTLWYNYVQDRYARCVLKLKKPLFKSKSAAAAVKVKKKFRGLLGDAGPYSTDAELPVEVNSVVPAGGILKDIKEKAGPIVSPYD